MLFVAAQVCLVDYNKDAGAKAVAALSKEFGAGRCVCLLPLTIPIGLRGSAVLHHTLQGSL